MAKYPGNPYTLKNHKHFNGHDGNGFDASLYCDGKRIGTVSDNGWGGPLTINIDKPEAEDALNAYAATLPLDGEYKTQPDAEDVIFDALDDVLDNLDRKSQLQWMRRTAKKKTLFLIGEDEEGDGWRTVNAPCSEKVLSYLREKYPSNNCRYWDPSSEMTKLL